MLQGCQSRCVYPAQLASFRSDVFVSLFSLRLQYHLLALLQSKPSRLCLSITRQLSSTRKLSTLSLRANLGEIGNISINFFLFKNVIFLCFQSPLLSDSSAAGFAEALPVLTDHLAFLDRSIQRPLREYNDCQVLDG